jgi:hypothetical protein
LLNYALLRKTLSAIRDFKEMEFNVQTQPGETIIKEVEVIKYVPAEEVPKKQITHTQAIEELLKKLEEEGINHVEIDIANPVSFDDSHKYLKMLTGKQITHEQYHRLKSGLERRYYFSYDSKTIMFEEFIKNKNRSVHRISMNRRRDAEREDNFTAKNYFLNKEKLEKQFENEPKNQEDLLAMIDAYVNIVKKGVGNKITDQMNIL